MSRTSENQSPVSQSNLVAAQEQDAGIFTAFRPYAHSKAPMYLLSSLFGVSALLPPGLFRPQANIPNFLFRAGFSAIYGGAGYVLSTGDTRNGCGISTAWCIAYLMLNARKTLTAPRHPLGLLLTGSVTACTALYGTEYFVYQD
ncbi:hypothetical protein BDN71DRAFT_1503630 [Pleurotus eryngii]|uniref:Uncharacterized protein n=1 Tax=Pleurotus eryngii TaxID=5323 RepID=A0A9P6A4J6_PLEER|nr:hypothetical protein BDN71DRAFT_1503630 [Pleurotus eryngii]